MTNVSISRILSDPTLIKNLQTCLDVNTDTDLRFAMYCLKNTSGNVLKFLAKNQPAQVNEVYLNPIDAVVRKEGAIYFDNTTKSFKALGSTIAADITVGEEIKYTVVNKDTVTLNKGDIVYISGAVDVTASHVSLQVKKAIATAVNTASDLLIIQSDSITVNNEGVSSKIGAVTGLLNASIATNLLLYLSATTAGTYTVTAPTDPNLSIKIGRSLVNDGTNLTSLYFEPEAKAQLNLDIITAAERAKLVNVPDDTNTELDALNTEIDNIKLTLESLERGTAAFYYGADTITETPITLNIIAKDPSTNDKLFVVDAATNTLNILAVSNYFNIVTLDFLKPNAQNVNAIFKIFNLGTGIQLGTDYVMALTGTGAQQKTIHIVEDNRPIGEYYATLELDDNVACTLESTSLVSVVAFNGGVDSLYIPNTATVNGVAYNQTTKNFDLSALFKQKILNTSFEVIEDTWFLICETSGIGSNISIELDCFSSDSAIEPVNAKYAATQDLYYHINELSAFNSNANYVSSDFNANIAGNIESYVYYEPEIDIFRFYVKANCAAGTTTKGNIKAFVNGVETGYISSRITEPSLDDSVNHVGYASAPQGIARYNNIALTSKRNLTCLSTNESGDLEDNSSELSGKLDKDFESYTSATPSDDTNHVFIFKSLLTGLNLSANWSALKTAFKSAFGLPDNVTSELSNKINNSSRWSLEVGTNENYWYRILHKTMGDYEKFEGKMFIFKVSGIQTTNTCTGALDIAINTQNSDMVATITKTKESNIELCYVLDETLNEFSLYFKKTDRVAALDLFSIGGTISAVNYDLTSLGASTKPTGAINILPVNAHFGDDDILTIDWSGTDASIETTLETLFGVGCLTTKINEVLIFSVNATTSTSNPDNASGTYTCRATNYSFNAWRIEALDTGVYANRLIASGSTLQRVWTNFATL